MVVLKNIDEFSQVLFSQKENIGIVYGNLLKGSSLIMTNCNLNVVNIINWSLSISIQPLALLFELGLNDRRK